MLFWLYDQLAKKKKKSLFLMSYLLPDLLMLSVLFYFSRALPIMYAVALDLRIFANNVSRSD